MHHSKNIESQGHRKMLKATGEKELIIYKKTLAHICPTYFPNNECQKQVEWYIRSIKKTVNEELYSLKLPFKRRQNKHIPK